MKTNLTSFIFSILLHIALAGALVYAYNDKPDANPEHQAITVSIVMASPQPQKPAAVVKPEPVVEHQIEQPPLETIPELKPEPKPKPQKVALNKPKPKPEKKPQEKRKPKKQKKEPIKTASPKAKRKIRNTQDQEWAKLLQPTPVAKPQRTVNKSTKAAIRPSRNPATNQHARSQRAAAQPVAARALASNTKSLEISYKSRLRQLIESQKKYPKRAKRKGDEGIVIVSFVVHANGIINQINIKKSSGSSILDSAAQTAIRKISGRLPFPGDIKKRHWRFSLPLTYRLN